MPHTTVARVREFATLHCCNKLVLPQHGGSYWCKQSEVIVTRWM